MTDHFASRHAAPDAPIHELIQRRWSPRAYDASRAIEPDKLASVLEAGRWAASAFNEQPWRVLVGVRGDAGSYQKLLAALAEFNRSWATAAPVLGVLLTRTAFTQNGKPNRHAEHDAGAWLATVTLEAAYRDLLVHPMAGFDADSVRREFHVPPEFEPLTAFTIGYAGLPDLLENPTLRERETAPRVRRPLAETVFEGDWGRAADLPLNRADAAADAEERTEAAGGS